MKRVIQINNVKELFNQALVLKNVGFKTLEMRVEYDEPVNKKRNPRHARLIEEVRKEIEEETNPTTRKEDIEELIQLQKEINQQIAQD